MQAFNCTKLLWIYFKQIVLHRSFRYLKGLWLALVNIQTKYGTPNSRLHIWFTVVYRYGLQSFADMVYSRFQIWFTVVYRYCLQSFTDMVYSRLQIWFTVV